MKLELPPELHIGEPIVPKSLKGYTLDQLSKELFSLYLEPGPHHMGLLNSVSPGFKLFERMIKENDTIWLGIAGVGIVEGQGKYVIDLIEKGFIDTICSTGAQIYHDLHYAYGLPMYRINPHHADDNALEKAGFTRIYDVVIRTKETLLKQDKIISNFIKTYKKRLSNNFKVSSVLFNRLLGEYVRKTAPYPELSFVAACAEYNVPLFWDSDSNHSIALGMLKYFMDGTNIVINQNLDLLSSAAIVYKSEKTGFLELGGGGPKNYIQQTFPILDQFLDIKRSGADHGFQITTAPESNAGLSGCTFSEGKTWGKYNTQCIVDVDIIKILGDYRILFPLIAQQAYHECKPRELKHLYTHLNSACKEVRDEYKKGKQ